MKTIIVILFVMAIATSIENFTLKLKHTHAEKIRRRSLIIWQSLQWITFVVLFTLIFILCI